MRPDLEPEMEALLHRLYPRLDDEVEGATSSEIDKIREIVGHELPRFYEWFLARMGRNMGPLASPYIDYSAARVLWCYQQGLAEPDPDDLLIGYDVTGDPMDLHIFYDFRRPCREDAMIAKGEPDAGPVYPEFETFREQIGWGKTMAHVVMKSPSYCKGIVRSLTSINAVDQLKKLMNTHGFEEPLSTGSYCGIFMRADMTMTCSRDIVFPTDMAAFQLGGKSEAWLRRFLGEIELSDGLELCDDIYEWGGASG